MAKKPDKTRRYRSLMRRRFGLLKVVGRSENDKNGNARWVCECKCGGTCIALGCLLKADRKTHCGCKGGRGRPRTRVPAPKRTEKGRPKTKALVGEELLTLGEWAARYGIHVDTIRARLRAGWSSEKAITTPARVGHPGRKVTFNGETLCIADWERRLHFKPDTISHRLAAGWSVEDALTTPVAYSTAPKKNRARLTTSTDAELFKSIPFLSGRDKK